jgi:hypothetical protein
MPPASVVANVPTEVLQHVFYHLGPGGGASQSVCTRVCKAWRVRQKRDAKWTDTDIVCVKDAAESVLYSEITCYQLGTMELKSLAQSLRDASLEGRDLAGHITKFTFGHDDNDPLYISKANAFSDILTEARHLRCLDVSYPDLSLLAVIIACRTHPWMERLAVDIHDSTYMSILSHIGQFAHLHHLELRFEPYPVRVGQLPDVKCVPWDFPHLRSLSIEFRNDTLAPVVGRLLEKSNFPVLRKVDLTLALFPKRTNLMGGHELAKFFSRLSLRSIQIHSNQVSEGILIAILPHMHTPHLETGLLDATVVSLLPRTVTVLHSMTMGIEYDGPDGEQAWTALDLLRRGETGVQEFTTDEWWGADSWVTFLELEGLDERKERAQMRRTRYATLLGAKGIRFTDPQGKTMAEYMDGAR